MLYKRGNTYWAKFKVGGQTHRVSCRTSHRATALVEAARQKADIAARLQGRRRGACRLSQLASADIQRAMSKGVDKATRERTLDWIWHPMLAFFGPGRDPQSITYDDAEAYIAHRRSIEVRGQTIRREMQALRRGMKIAKRRGWMTEVPEEWPPIASDPPSPEHRGKLHPPKALRMWLEQLAPDARDECLFALCTGLRGKELKRVRANWVEPLPPGFPTPALLRIPAASAKTRRERMVGLPQEALDIIRRRIEAHPGAVLVFSQASHTRTMTQARKRIGYAQNITMRDLRHTYSTLALQGTGDATAVQAAMGHTDLRTTQLYQSSTLLRTAQVSAAAARLLSEVKGAQSGGTENGPETQNGQN